MFKYKFENGRNYLIACSYGPDSMALLSMLLEYKIKPIVCNVDYHVREEAPQEEADLRKYCEEKSLIFECLDARTIKMQGNFEAWARDIRYMFFSQMYVKYNAAAIFVAHHQDDLIETYLLQKERNNEVAQFGIKRVSKINGMTVVRPLLNYTKKDLYYYCIENHIPFSVDRTNFDRRIARNRIRQDIINKLSVSDRETLLNEINNENQQLTNFNATLDDKIQISDELDIRTIIAFSTKEFAEVMRRFVNKEGTFIKLSAGQIEEIRKLCLSSEPNLSMRLSDNKFVVKEYDVLVIQNGETPSPYSYSFQKPSRFDCNEFSIDFTKGSEDRHILNTDYPIIIRSPHLDDEYCIGDYSCELRRLFIDWKMPARLRNVWPVVVNSHGKIIYVPRYRKNFVDNHISKFEIKL